MLEWIDMVQYIYDHLYGHRFEHKAEGMDLIDMIYLC